MGNQKARHGRAVAKKSTRWRVALFVVGCLALSVPLIANVSFGIGFSPVLSQSMQPAFAAGDLEITRRVPATTVAVGDVVVLSDPETQAKYSHRVTSVAGAAGAITFATRGDANPSVDRNPVIIDSAAQIAKVVTTVPWLGYGVLFFSSAGAGWAGLALLAFAATLFLARFFVRKFLNHQPKEITI